MSTINEIAQRAKVSRTTVSRYLNDSGYVSDQARQRILKAIEETGYVPSEHAKALRTKQSKVIGVIVPKISTETAARVANGIDEELVKEGYQILLANTNLEWEKEIEHLKLLKSRQVDGIILTATTINEKLVQEIQQLSIPVVAIGQHIPGISTVVYNDYEASKEVMSFLLDKGHQKIAFIGVDESDHAVGYLRKQGYLDALKESNIPIIEEWIQTAVFDIQSGYDAMRMVLEQSSEAPTATFAVTDRLAIGASQYLKQEGYSIPQDMALVGIGHSEIAKYVTPPLTTIDYENERAGREAARLILDHLQNENLQPKKITLDYRLVIKDSV